MTRISVLPRLTVVAALLTTTVFSVHASSLEAAPTRAWTYAHSGTNGFLSEIVAYDSVNQQLWVGGVSGVDILNAGTGAFVDRINITGGSINSVAIKNGVAAFAIESTNREAAGEVRLYNTTTRTLLSGTNTISVGALPDMLTFTPDGSKLLVANEGTPNNTSMPGITSANSHYGARTTASNVFPRNFTSNPLDPVGSVSIIDMSSRTVTATANPNTATRTGSNIRTNTGMDFEPEYIAVNASGTKAYVTLQEANAMGVLDIASGSFDKVVGLGVKDFNASGNRIDTRSNSSPTLTTPTVSVKGLYMPDGITAFEANGQTFLAMANEGDYREDDADRSNGSVFGATGDLADVRVSNTDSSTTELLLAGARSFSIRDIDGNVVYDSGEILDREAIALGLYDDERSRQKGVEPEGIEVMSIGARTYAFVGLERTLTSAIGVFDITDPVNSSFVTMLVGAGDLSPEGLKGFESNGVSFLAYSNEVSNTTSLFQLTASAVPEPSSYALALAGLGLIGLMRRRKQG